MSDAAIAQVVTGAVTIAGMTFGFLTIWVKLRYAGTKAEEAVKAAKVVENKLDANTRTTDVVNTKADTIVKQTDGAMEQVRTLVANISERVVKLEEYNHTTAHRVLDAINATHLKLTEIAAMNAVAQGRNPLPIMPIEPKEHDK